MKNLTKTFFFFSLILLAASCKKETYKLNEEFTLEFNKTALIKIGSETLEIKFTELIEESRCQPGTECFWQGQVAVKIRVNQETDFTIGHHTTIPATAEYKSHTIRLLEVKYDQDINFGKENHYSIKLKVE